MRGVANFPGQEQVSPESVPSRRCVLLFARSPRAEERAKRLPGAAALFGLAAFRVEAAVAALAGVDLVAVGPDAQRGRTFGERLANAFAGCRSRGYDQVVAVPGDVPQLAEAHLAAAFDALAAREVVFGPSADGGVWLIGVRGDAGGLLAGVPWLTASVFAALMANAPRAAVLTELLDVDGRAGLAPLARAARAAADRDLAAAVAILLVPVRAVPGVAPRRALAAPLFDRFSARAPPSLSTSSC
jgi:uncharacterized protein